MAETKKAAFKIVAYKIVDDAAMLADWNQGLADDPSLHNPAEDKKISILEAETRALVKSNPAAAKEAIVVLQEIVNDPNANAKAAIAIIQQDLDAMGMDKGLDVHGSHVHPHAAPGAPADKGVGKQ